MQKHMLGEVVNVKVAEEGEKGKKLRSEYPFKGTSPVT